MADRVSFVYSKDINSDDEPVALIVLKNGMLRFHAPTGSPYRENISGMNNRSLNLDENDAEEFFEDFSDSWDNRYSRVVTFPLTGRDARRAEVLIAKWNK